MYSKTEKEVVKGQNIQHLSLTDILHICKSQIYDLKKVFDYLTKDPCFEIKQLLR